MKKLLLGASILLGSIVSTNAQTTIFKYNFSTSGTNMPAGWSNDKSASSDPDSTGWYFNNTFPHISGSLYTAIPAHGYYAFVDDYDYNTGHEDDDTLYLPSINCSSYTHVFISLDLMFWYDPYNGDETSRIAVSTDGGTTWQTAVHLGAYGTTTSAVWLDSLAFDISSYAAGHSNVMLAITYGNGWAAQETYPGFGMAVANIDVFAPLNYDLSVATQNTPFLMKVGTPYSFSGTINNYGGDSISSMDMNYSVNGGTAQTQTISGISGFDALTYYDWTINTPQFTPSAPGTYNIKFWADNLNGSNVDQNHSNDTLEATFVAAGTVTPRQPLYEEFTGQSCVYCMIAGPNLDSVSAANASTSNIIKYHVPIPGRDFMYNVTSTPVNVRRTYYGGVNSAPQGYLDGISLDPSTYNSPPVTSRYSSVTVQNDNAVGSLFDIQITSANFDAAKDSFSVSANITSSIDLPAGITAQVALTIDSITYLDDCSQDDPTKSFAPPIGSSASGYSYSGAPDSYYQYVLKFPHVVEAMLPSASGTTLGAFTAGQAQTISLGWKQNHPWGQYPKGGGHNLGDSTVYDSSATGQFVVFVQSNSAITGDGIPAKYVFQSASAPLSNITGMQEISNGIYFEMYPNPTNNSTNLAFNLDKSQNVNVDVYNMLGERVYSVNKGTMSAGMHTISVNCSTLPNGMYFVRFNTDNASATNKLLIQR